MKKILACSILAFASIFAFAGDAASFDDIGFSKDGKYYIFGTYGKTDKEYKAWAEIYTVDVEKNDFVKGEVYKINLSGKDSEISGKNCYLQLKADSEWRLAKYEAKPADAETLLFLRESEKKDPEAEIVFQDFEASKNGEKIYYHVKLIPTFEGKGKSVKSKFYIDVKRQNEDGEVISSWKVGSPDIKRKGITSYQIDRIFTDKSGKNLVFIIQKTLEDSKGTSIRYMVETYTIDN